MFTLSYIALHLLAASAGPTAGSAAAQQPAVAAPRQGVAKGEVCPPFAGWTMDDNVLSSNQIFGPDERGPVVLAFFATWCKPCVEHLPLIEDVTQRTGALGTRAILAAFGQSAMDVQPLLRALSIKFPVILDEKYAIAKRFGVEVLPRVYVIGPDARVEAILTEADHDFARALETALRRSVAAADARAIAAARSAPTPATPPPAGGASLVAPASIQGGGETSSRRMPAGTP